MKVILTVLIIFNFAYSQERESIINKIFKSNDSGGMGNGGDPYQNDFQRYGKKVHELLTKYKKSGELSEELQNIDLYSFEEAVLTTTVEFVSKHKKMQDRYNIEKETLNFPDFKLIRIDRSFWDIIVYNKEQKIRHITHEYLGISRQEINHYNLSNAVVDFLIYEKNEALSFSDFDRDTNIRVLRESRLKHLELDHDIKSRILGVEPKIIDIKNHSIPIEEVVIEIPITKVEEVYKLEGLLDRKVSIKQIYFSDSSSALTFHHICKDFGYFSNVGFKTIKRKKVQKYQNYILDLNYSEKSKKFDIKQSRSGDAIISVYCDLGSS